MDWGIHIQNTFRLFNLAEGVFWIVLGLTLLGVMIRQRRNLDLMTAAGLLFVTFGLSDFVEIQTGGWYKPWWMLTWKGTNLAGLIGVYALFQRRRFAAIPVSEPGRVAPEPSQSEPGGFFQALLIASTLAFSWLGMMVVHEFGHVLHLWLSGGRVNYVVLLPLALSYTHPAENPHPLFVAWGGALWGCVLPLVLLVVFRCLAQRYAYLAAFFAGFCLITNGAYLTADAFVRGGDGRELIGFGSPPWLLVALGLPLVVLGLWLWNGLGPHFGLGPSRGQVDRRAALGMTLALAALVSLEILLAG